MGKQVYISADYSKHRGDRVVVETLNKWGKDNLRTVDFIDMSRVASGSVSDNSDCRICDLKGEFNKQINASSAVIFIVGDNTASRKVGSNCEWAIKNQGNCSCTPYKQNNNGSASCKVISTTRPGENDDVGYINTYSYLKHEFEQAKKRNKKIIVVYNSLRKESTWLPPYMKEYESCAQPFWSKNSSGEKVGNYSYLKLALGYV